MRAAMGKDAVALPALTPLPTAPEGWRERIQCAIEARKTAEQRWKGKYPVSRQTWPIELLKN